MPPADKDKAPVVTDKPNADVNANTGNQNLENTADSSAAAAGGSKAGKAKAKQVGALLVRSLDRNGFRRAGMKFTSEPVLIEVDALTPEDYKAITEEPRLAVEHVKA